MFYLQGRNVDSLLLLHTGPTLRVPAGTLLRQGRRQSTLQKWPSLLTLWRRNFLLNFSTPVFKM
jgi:hypothetical protein